jgi:hypothetical protein
LGIFSWDLATANQVDERVFHNLKLREKQIRPDRLVTGGEGLSAGAEKGIGPRNWI